MSANYPSLKDRVVIVTGGAQGLGRSFVTNLAEQGAKPIIVQRNFELAKELEQELNQKGHDTFAIRADIGSQESVQKMVAQVHEKYGRIDILVNNAAMLKNLAIGPFWEIPMSEWYDAINVNITGAFICAREVVPYMQKRNWGRIVNLSSTTILSGKPNYLHYSASKSAMIGITRAMARELGDWNITVNNLMPGTTKTESDRTSAHDEYFANAVKQQSIHRLATVQDHANALMFLCSDEAGFITGQCMVSDGGRSFL
jgi:3-oxoacyl-[acyl-carrier protein] reductase